MPEKRSKWPWVLILLLAAATAVFAVQSGFRGDRIDKLAKELESTELERDGFRTADETSARKLNEAVQKTDTLEEQLERLRETTDAEPERVIRWKTNPVNIDMQAELERLRLSRVTVRTDPVEPVDCPIPVPIDVPGLPDLPDYQVAVGGVSVEVKTRAGNRVALGEVEIFGGFEGLTLRPVAVAPWEADLTEFSVARETVKPAPRNELSLGWHSDSGGEGRYTRLLTRRRLSAYVGASYSRAAPDGFQGFYGRTDGRVSAGLGWRW